MQIQTVKLEAARLPLKTFVLTEFGEICQDLVVKKAAYVPDMWFGQNHYSQRNSGSVLSSKYKLG